MDFAAHDSTAAMIGQWLVPLLGSLAAALCDLRTRRIPNALTATLLLAGLMMSVCSRGPAGLGDAGLGVLIMALPFVGLFLFGGGAGDAKLMGAIGAWLGMTNSILAVLAVVAAGAVLGMLYALLKRRARVVLANTRDLAWHAMAVVMTGGWALSRPSTTTGMAGNGNGQRLLAAPYGVAIFTGLCVAATVRWLWLT